MSGFSQPGIEIETKSLVYEMCHIRILNVEAIEQGLGCVVSGQLEALHF